jgi:serine/threonine protein kinase
MTQQTPKVDARTFIDNVIVSGLIDSEELARTLKDFPETDKAKVVAKHLMKAGLLTRFQAERLIVGKTDGYHLGQYRILEELGRGGMGRVYKAMHMTMGRVVALKILSPDLTKTDRAKALFEREVRAAAKLIHPNIVTAYDANQANERFFLVMEFVDGPNLSRLVKDKGVLPVPQACEFIRQTAIALDHAHKMGLVHRDVKPSNILVQKAGTGPHIKILDFGLAQMTAGGQDAGISTQTASNTVLGTPDYVSPEQARDAKSADARSDLYSLGCTFYYLLTGQVPFPGGTPLEKILRHSSDPPPSVQSLRSDVPDPVAHIVHKLLAKNPIWRYGSAAELAGELEHLAEGGMASWTPSDAFPAADHKSSSGENHSDPELEIRDEPWTRVDGEASSATLANGAISTRMSLSSTGKLPTIKKTSKYMEEPNLMWLWIVLIAVFCLGTASIGFLLVRFLTHSGAPAAGG